MPLALLLVLVVAGLAASAFDEAATQRSLAGARLAHQRAFLAAGSGLELAAREVGRSAAADGGRSYRLPAATDQATVRWQLVEEDPLPQGFSGARFVERSYEMQSTGTSVRNARVTQAQAISRVEPAGELQPNPATP